MAIVLRFLLGLITAIGAFALALRINPSTQQFFDPFIVLVIYQALRAQTAPSAGVGTLVGLIQDTFTGGLYGLHGFANTLVAYCVSAVRQRFLIQQPLQVAVLAALGGALQLAALAFLQFSLLPDPEMPHPGYAVIKMSVTGLLTTGVYMAANRFFAWDRDRREKSSRKLRLGT